MRTTLNRFVMMAGFCLMTALPLRAQTNTPLEPGGDHGEVYGAKDFTLEAGKLQLEKMHIDKDLESDRVKAEKEIAESKENSRRLMVHDIAWNSWVIFVIAIFFFGYLRDKRRHETIRLMIEKGTPITPELLDGLRKKSRLTVRTSYDTHGYLGWGITLVLVGIVLVAAFDGGGRLAGWIVLAVGVADLILWFIDRANSNNGQSK